MDDKQQDEPLTPRIPLDEWVEMMQRELAKNWNPRPIWHARLWEQEEEDTPCL